MDALKVKSSEINFQQKKKLHKNNSLSTFILRYFREKQYESIKIYWNYQTLPIILSNEPSLDLYIL